ncbi:MAG: molybdopterin biosynthesis protein [Methylocystaceae bacterium]
MKRNVYIDNYVWEEARNQWYQALGEAGTILGTEVIKVAEARGRITASPVRAEYSCPHYPAAAMDGIAVVSRKTRGASETSPLVLIETQDYLEVDTGDYVPEPFDAVIMVEEVNYPAEGRAEIRAAVAPYQHIRAIGEDVTHSEMLCPSMTKLGPYEIGCLLTAGVTEVEVMAKPRVIIIPTGTELVDAGTRPPASGEIIESNSWMLGGLVEESGGVFDRYPLLADDRELIKSAVVKAVTKADMVIICSGSSAGREDFSSGIVQELGTLVVHGVATKPGKPAILGVIAGKPVLGVPGYPVSAAQVFNLFARPLLLKMQGIINTSGTELEARVARKTASPMGVDEFVLCQVGWLDGDYRAYPLSRGAGVTSNLVKSDGVFVIPRGSEGVNVGEKVQVKLHRERGLIGKTLVCNGSHDLVIDVLGDIMYRQYGLRIISANTGSMGALAALRRREAHLGGMHLLEPSNGQYNISYVKKYLDETNCQLLNLVIRRQGIMVAPGNPLNISGIGDLKREEVRFINRQRGAGTRVLLDYLLEQEGIEPSQVNGYHREEFTHLAVAAAVEGGSADAALGIYASAQALGLDFIPVAEEDYDLCLLSDLWPDNWLNIMQKVINGNEFKAEVARLGGYDLRLSGSFKPF